MDEPRVHENASVLFMDIVSYSKQTVEQQAKLISLLQTTVRQSSEFASTEEKDLMVLPTGDGMAMVFTKNLVSPVQCALEIAEVIQAGNELKVRMGIYTGPILRHVDIREQSNVVGVHAAKQCVQVQL
jgi:class 3 adenylate cyclase